nr:MAG TPA: hypothetical protein [Caudoviricetes sp.]
MSSKLSIANAVFQHGMAGYGAYGDYKDARDQGRGKLASVAKAGTEFALGELMGGWYIPYQLAKAAPSMVVGGLEGAAKMQRSMNKTSRQVPFQNATFKDYSQAMTMRQAGMQMAQASRYNLQQAIMGNEAQYLR